MFEVTRRFGAAAKLLELEAQAFLEQLVTDGWTADETTPASVDLPTKGITDCFVVNSLFQTAEPCIPVDLAKL